MGAIVQARQRDSPFRRLRTQAVAIALPSSGPNLPNLPADVIECIGQHLELVDRVALTSCCRDVWANPAVAASPVLWGDLALQLRDFPTTRPGAKCREASFALCLLRRRGGLRRLELVWAPLPSVLGCLAGSSLRELVLTGVPLRERTDTEFLRPLRGSLTRLVANQCQLEGMPRQLSFLTALAHLDLANNDRRLRGQAGPDWAPLAELGRLTFLDLSRSWLPLYGAGRQPGLPQLAAQTALQELRASFNPWLGEGGDAALEPLRQVAGTLTRLDLAGCALRTLPPQLAALPALRRLDLADNKHLDLDEERSLGALMALAPTLTALSLQHCALPCFPAALSRLAGLAELDVRHNPGLSASGSDDALEPLGALTALTWLALGGCEFLWPPAVLAELRRLAHLHMDDATLVGGWDADAARPGQWGVEEQAAAEAPVAWILAHLRSLAYLGLHGREVPPRLLQAQLAALGAAGVEVEFF